MLQYLDLVVRLFGVFALSLAISYGVTCLVRSLRKTLPPPVDSRLRIMSASGVYRARFLGVVDGGWAFTAPIQRDAYVPLRSGDPLTIEATCDDGIMLFRTKLMRRTPEHSMIAAVPVQVFTKDRRSDRRVPVDLEIQVEEMDARLENVSSGGACVWAPFPISRGSRLKLDLPWLEEPAFAWVLASEQAYLGSRVRVRLEEPIVVPAE